MKQKNRAGGLLGALVIIVVVIVLLLVAFLFFRYHTKKGLQEGAYLGEALYDLYIPGEKTLVYEGEKYVYNENLLTFLVMGIDKSGVVEENPSLTEGGQSDAMFLLICNPKTEEFHILAINRNTMAQIRLLGVAEDGSDLYTTAPIAVQHGFGDGREESCELTVDAVSKLLYGLPIHGYVSIHYDAIYYINRAVGGVNVTVTEDLVDEEAGRELGDELFLWNDDALWYLRTRDVTTFGSADSRLERQKQYLQGFVAAAKTMIRKKPWMPLSLYQEIQDYVVTDLTTAEIVYLVSEASSYDFSSERLDTMAGETIKGEYYEEFYPDREALKRQIIDIFYEKSAAP